jgi:hypothetical protein
VRERVNGRRLTVAGDYQAAAAVRLQIPRDRRDERARRPS